MLDLEVVLDFLCVECFETTGVTVKCTGKSPSNKKNGLATVNISCPHCHCINQLLFSPEDGNLIHVFAVDKPRYLIPVPSLN